MSPGYLIYRVWVRAEKVKVSTMSNDDKQGSEAGAPNRKVQDMIHDTWYYAWDIQ
jgi:hypothetical protein